jgi:hypothetical protein
MLAALVQIAVQASAIAIHALHRNGTVSNAAVASIHDMVETLARGLAGSIPPPYVDQIRRAATLFPKP